MASLRSIVSFVILIRGIRADFPTRIRSYIFIYYSILMLSPACHTALPQKILLITSASVFSPVSGEDIGYLGAFALSQETYKAIVIHAPSHS